MPFGVVYVDRSNLPDCERGARNLRKEVKDGARDPHLVRDQYEDYWSEVLDHARRMSGRLHLAGDDRMQRRQADL